MTRFALPYVRCCVSVLSARSVDRFDLRRNHALFRHARKATAVTAVICASALLVASTEAVAAPKNDPNATSKKFRKAVTPGGIGLHLDAFQKIADANDGTRASRHAGLRRLEGLRREGAARRGLQAEGADLRTSRSSARTPTPSSQRTSPEREGLHARGRLLRRWSTPAAATVEGPVEVVDTDLEPERRPPPAGARQRTSPGSPPGAIALIQRGTCDFAVKAANAEDAGASAVVIFNRGTEGEDGGRSNGTLGGPGVGIPVVGTSYAVGSGARRQSGAEATRLHRHHQRDPDDVQRDRRDQEGERRPRRHGRRPPRQRVEGAGINDNGSGSAAVLEMAEELAKEKKLRNQVRFAWWGAEESGLLGAEHYVADLAANDPATLDEIGAYLNFDMVGSPNYVRFVYDGDNSDRRGRRGSGGLRRHRAAVHSLLHQPAADQLADRVRRPQRLRSVHRQRRSRRWPVHRCRGREDGGPGQGVRRRRRRGVRPVLPLRLRRPGQHQRQGHRRDVRRCCARALRAGPEPRARPGHLEDEEVDHRAKIKAKDRTGHGALR